MKDKKKTKTDSRRNVKEVGKNSVRQGKPGLFGIRNKIYLCFLIPIIFMIGVGYVSYHYAAEGMKEQFMDASVKTLNLMTKYLDFNTSQIATEAMTLAFDTDIQDYLLGMPAAYDSEKARFYNTERNNLSIIQSLYPEIASIHLIPRDNMNIISTYKSDKIPGIYDAYKEEMLKKSKNPKILDKWATVHKTLDETLGIPADSYYITCQQKASNGMGCVVIDINKEAMADILRQASFSGKSYIGFITEDGSEIAIAGSEGEMVSGQVIFADKDFFSAALNSGELAGSQNVSFDGSEYLFMYQTSEETSITTCALIPYDVITADAQRIRMITILLVIASTVIALLVGSIIANGIQKNMKRISGKLDEVANGNLSVSVNARGRDEFQGLARAASNMIENNKKLVTKLSGTADELATSALDVNEASRTISGFSNDITGIIDEIGESLKKQSEHAQECVRMTSSLSERINDISVSVSEVETIIDETEHLIRKGTDIVDNLAGRTKQTSELTKIVGNSIGELKDDITSITGFVDTINSISGETNLLSLNASIEAARAGEAGRGFAVVAEEIRTLADNSSEAAEEIGRKIKKVSDQTQVSVQSANNAENMVELQTKAVAEVTDVFTNINAQMRSLFNALKNISDNTELADKERLETVEAVDNITAIIDMTTSSSDKVRDMAVGLMDNVDKLGDTADLLDNNMNGLKDEISAFTIE
ncbi:MAG: methyl-accepting chemotaxis protein [Lachnospiraceae bacterium]|nr:methyl-accepting chemotaxis protein [Lachnospiraceae bacterium]